MNSTFRNNPTTFLQEDMTELIEKYFPTLYYMTDLKAEEGKIFYVKECQWSPECIVCHPNDLEYLREKIRNRTLVHVKNEPWEITRVRIFKYMKTNFPSVTDVTVTGA